jgi:hypothetical protein
MDQIKPNFLIVGAAKCGTTSLHRYLSQHPQIFMPEWKELSLFIDDPFGPLHRVPSAAVYYRLFEKAAGFPARGEASTAYLYNPASPRLIRSALKDPRIVIILRDPVAMSYSLYHHEYRKEGETIDRFEDALAVEPNRMKDPGFQGRCFGWHANYYYFHRGLYTPQVKRYLERFGPARVCILLFEELKHSPLATVRTLYRFLGVDDAFVPELKIYNKAGELLNVPRFWSDGGLFLKTAQYALKGNVFRKMPHLLRNLIRPRLPKMRPKTARRLRRRFRPDIEALEKLIERDLSRWK